MGGRNRHVVPCRWTVVFETSYIIICTHTFPTHFPYTLAKLAILILYPSLWLLVPGLDSQILFHCFLYNVLAFISVVMSIIFEKWLQDFVTFGNPCILCTSSFNIHEQHKHHSWLCSGVLSVCELCHTTSHHHWTSVRVFA